MAEGGIRNNHEKSDGLANIKNATEKKIIWIVFEKLDLLTIVQCYSEMLFL